MSSRRRRPGRSRTARPRSSTAREYRRLHDTLGPEHPDTRAAWQDRADELLTEEQADPAPGLWWVTFTSQGEVVGCCIVVADGPAGALRQTHLLGINPGGSANIAGPVPVDDVPEAWRLEWCLRLLTPEEVDAMPDPDAG